MLIHANIYWTSQVSDQFLTDCELIYSCLRLRGLYLYISLARISLPQLKKVHLAPVAVLRINITKSPSIQKCLTTSTSEFIHNKWRVCTFFDYIKVERKNQTFFHNIKKYLLFPSQQLPLACRHHDHHHCEHHHWFFRSSLKSIKTAIPQFELD